MRMYLLMLHFALALTVPIDAYAACNVFRVSLETGDDANLKSDVSICSAIYGGTELPVPTEEDKAAWVTFMGNHCRTTLNTLQEIEDRNAYYQCKYGEFTTLPPPAVTSFEQGLDFYYQDLTSLNGLELVTKLPSLDIRYTDVTSLAPLSSLKEIDTLYGSRTGLLNLNGLEGITSANRLHFDVTSVANIDGLSNLKSINSLKLNNTPLVSVAPLSSLISASELSLGYAALQSLEGLEGIISLDSLNVTANNLTNFKGLENLVSVTTDLRAGFNVGLLSLDGLESLRSVGGNLIIRKSTKLEDIRALSGLESAGKVWFYDTFTGTKIPTHRMAFDSSFCKGWRAKDIAVLHNSPIGYNAICEEDKSEDPESYWVRFVNDECNPVDPYGKVSELENASVQCRGAYYSRVTYTSIPTQPELSKIQSFYFSGANVGTLKGLSNVTSVVGTLDLNNTGITSLQGLNSLVSAKTLNLANGDFRDVNGLSSLTSVENLYLSGGDIEDLRGLSNLSSVTGSLFLSSNNLGTLYGLENVTSVGGRLDLTHNDSLYSLQGIQNLSSATTVDLRFTSLFRKLPDDTPFCIALMAGDLGEVKLDTGMTNDDLCDSDTLVGEQGEASLGGWVASDRMLIVGSLQGAMLEAPTGVCSIGEDYYKSTTVPMTVSGDMACSSFVPWGYGGTQNYGNNYSASHGPSTGSSSSGVEGGAICYGVEAYSCQEIDPEGHWELQDNFAQVEFGSTSYYIDKPSGICEIGKSITRILLESGERDCTTTSASGSVQSICKAEVYSCVASMSLSE
jgi:hypothetical protein